MPQPSVPASPSEQPGARTALILLLAINLFNYIDRFILAAVAPKLRMAFLQDDPDAKGKIGLLSLAFMVAYMVLAPLFGWLADRGSRWFLISLGVILWSLASGASGLSIFFVGATGYWVLLVTRCFVGVGEAAYGPAAPTLISDLFALRIRGQVLAFFYAAIPIGAALGYVFGGQIDHWLGWPWAFYLVVPPGVLLGILCLFMHEPARGQADAGHAIPDSALRPVSLAEKGAPANAIMSSEVSSGVRQGPPGSDAIEGVVPAADMHGDPGKGAQPSASLDISVPGGIKKGPPGLQAYRELVRIPSFVLNTLGMTAMTFALGGLSWWLPDYVSDREGKCVVTAKIIEDMKHQETPMPQEAADKLQSLIGEEIPLPKFRDVAKAKLGEHDWRTYGEPLINASCSPSLASINLNCGAIIAISGLTATLLGGWLGDTLKKRFPGSYFLISGLAMFVGFPMVILVLVLPFPVAWVFVFLAVFFLMFNTGPTNTILANTTPAAIRSTGFALNIFIIHALGDAISPAVMGTIADHSSMDVAFAVVSAVVLVGGVFWLWGVKYLERDTALASTRL